MGSTRKTGLLNPEWTSASFDLALALELSQAPHAETDCPGFDLIAAYYEGRLAQTEVSLQEKHLARCISCQSQVATLARVDESAASPRRESPRSESRLPVWSVLGLGLAAAAGIAIVSMSRTRHPSPPGAQMRETPLALAILPETPAPSSIQAPKSGPGETAGSAIAALAGPAFPLAPSPKPAEGHPRLSIGAAKIAAAQPPQRGSKTGGEEQPTKSTEDGTKVGMNEAWAPVRAEHSVDEEEEARNQATLALPRFELSSPGESAYWRVGIDGSIAWSEDGDHWELQRQGDGVSIESGMATDAFVCWLVGAKGTILRSADGTTWSRVASPTTDNLIGVSVRNADVATITTSGGKRFQTTNGGRDWNLVLG